MGVTEGADPVPPDASAFSVTQTDDFYAGQQLIRSFVATYEQSKTGLGAEIVNYFRTAEQAIEARREWFINSRRAGAPPPIDARNILRPETVESLLFAYRITGDPVYREWGWRIFEAFERHCRLPGGGYAGIRDVDEVPVVHEDRMETFWIAETLKYLYLLFSDASVYPIDQLVANTEVSPARLHRQELEEPGLILWLSFPGARLTSCPYSPRLWSSKPRRMSSPLLKTCLRWQRNENLLKQSVSYASRLLLWAKVGSPATPRHQK